MGQRKPLRKPTGMVFSQTGKPDSRQEINYGPLANRLSYVVRRAQLAVSQGFFETMADLQISPVQYSALVVIANNPGLSQTQVSDALGVKKANFVGLIRELEWRKLVERRNIPGDRRSFALHLTETGQAICQTLDDLSARHEAAIREAIGEETYAALFEPLRRLARLNGHGGIPTDVN